MADGYDPRDGELMVPFDLRKDVIDRLDEHGRKMIKIGDQIDDHVAGHDAALDSGLKRHDDLRREERRAWIKRALKIAAAVGATALPLLIGLATRG